MTFTNLVKSLLNYYHWGSVGKRKKKHSELNIFKQSYFLFLPHQDQTVRANSSAQPSYGGGAFYTTVSTSFIYPIIVCQIHLTFYLFISCLIQTSIRLYRTSCKTGWHKSCGLLPKSHMLGPQFSTLLANFP